MSPTKQNSGGKKDKKEELDAANALTKLGDEDSGEEGNKSAEEDNNNVKQEQEEKEDAEEEEEPTTEGGVKLPSKRYIPDYKKSDSALTFPEKLMKLMMWADKQPKDFCCAWIADGKSFVIRDPDTFTRKVVPKYFKPTKFSSFTRKLYRWGFRQVNRGIGPDDPIIFGNDYFQRDNAELMSRMRSTTAVGQRKQAKFNAAHPNGYPHPGMDQEQNQRMFMERFYQQQAMGMGGGFGYGPGGMNPMMMQQMPPGMQGPPGMPPPGMQGGMPPPGMQGGMPPGMPPNGQMMMQNRMPGMYGAGQQQPMMPMLGFPLPQNLTSTLQESSKREMDKRQSPNTPEKAAPAPAAGTPTGTTTV